ncbi:MAG: hypothetical protein LBN19_03200 [Endomicrobium sp.]|jgi:hypothetical protein|nr:hypothetical protein [Endomicrobium sp.]
MKKVICLMLAGIMMAGVTGCAKTPFEKYEKAVNNSRDGIIKFCENFTENIKDCKTANECILSIKSEVAAARMDIKNAGAEYLYTTSGQLEIKKKMVKDINNNVDKNYREIEKYLIKLVRLADKEDIDGIEQMHNRFMNFLEDKDRIVADDIFDKYRHQVLEAK